MNRGTAARSGTALLDRPRADCGSRVSRWGVPEAGLRLVRPEDKRGVSGSGTESSGHDRGRRRRERPGRGREVFEGVRGATCGFRVTLETAGHGHGRGRPAPSRTTQTASGQRLQAWFVTTDATGFWRAEVKDAADQPTGRPRSPQQRMVQSQESAAPKWRNRGQGSTHQ